RVGRCGGRSVGVGVDEDRVAGGGDGGAPLLELARELARLDAELEAEAVEEAFVTVGDGDVDPPVVAHQAGILPYSARVEPVIRSEIPVWSRCFVMPPRKNGYPAPRIRHASMSAAAPTTPSSSMCRTSSAIASSASSRISSTLRLASPETTISSLPSAKFASVGESGKRSGYASCSVSST